MTIKDNSEYEISIFNNDLRILLDRIKNKNIEELVESGIFVYPPSLKKIEDIDEKQFVFIEKNHIIKTKNLMGFIGYNNETLIINSRFSNEDNDYFILYILNKVLNINIVDYKTKTNYDEKIIQYLVYLFPYYLKSALRKGPYKTYSKKQYNDNNIKGSINFDRHIKINSPFIGNYAYDIREFSYDNNLMELIRHTIEYIKQKEFGNSILNIAKNEIKQVIEITNNYKIQDRNKIIFKNTQKRLRHAYYKEYNTLQKLCLLILNNKKHQIGKGEKQIYGVLFDGSWLWEEYINTILKNGIIPS